MNIFKAVLYFFLEALTPAWVKQKLARSKHLSDNQRWALAASAQLTEINRHSHDTLNPQPGKDSDRWATDLNAWWEASDHAEVLARLSWLETSGHRVDFRPVLGREVLAWDLVRLINVARWGFAARHLHEDEAWSHILGAAARLRAHYGSWEDLAQDYVLGHDQWAGERDSRFEQATQYLLDPENVRSPWNRVAWNSFVTLN